MRRTEQEVKHWLLGEENEFTDDEGGSYDSGMNFAGNMYLRQPKEERDSWVKKRLEAFKEYKSIGDDYADAYESGWQCAISWLSGQFDWDKDGVPVNWITGEPL